MNISYNWLKQFIDFDLSPGDLSELLTDIGLEVGKVHIYQNIKGGLEGVVIGHVLTCEKHPDADRLSVTTVDVGGEEPLQIVCGAPNVAVGQKVLVATVGTHLYNQDGTSFEIKKAKIRGQSSRGMICAEDELGLGDSHDGIMILPEDVPVGTLAKDHFDIETDHIYDIDLTPNRADATSHYGVAKDILAALRVRNNSKKEICVSTSDNFKIDSEELIFDVEVENPEACPRYCGVTLSDIKIKPSPDWLKTRLESIGVRPINNVVDITNYVLHELGQPLHAFDADKIPSKKIKVKFLAEGTNFISLDEQERKLSGEDLMICDGDDNPLCIGGVFGGVDSGVTASTTNIFLESAHFNPKSIRRSSTRHNLRTDAAKIYEKTSDINRCDLALKRAATLMVELAEARITSPVIDILSKPITRHSVALTLEKLNTVSGHSFNMDQVIDIMTALEMKIVDKNDDKIEVEVTTDKPDVLRDVDLIEEVLRIYGYNNIPEQTKIQFSVDSKNLSLKYDFKEKLANIMSGLGYNEMMGLSMTNSKLFNDNFPIAEQTRVLINNTSNIHLDTMRPNMLVSALEALQHNNNRNQKDIRFFEIGSIYHKNENAFIESEKLSFIIYGSQSDKNWLSNQVGDNDIYNLKSTIEAVLSSVGIQSYSNIETKQSYMEYAINYDIGSKHLGFVGKINSDLAKDFDLDRAVYYGELDIQSLLGSQNNDLFVEQISKYPSVQRDLALSIDQSVAYADLVKVIKSRAGALLKKIVLFDVYQNEEMKSAGKKSYALNLLFSDDTKTLNDKEVDAMINKIIKGLNKEVGAVLR